LDINISAVIQILTVKVLFMIT